MSFREKLNQRRLKGEAEEAVYEAFGKRKQEFKEGKKRVYPTAVCENLARQIQTACDPAPLESCPVEFPPDAELTPEQEATVSQTPSSPPPPPQPATRCEWGSETVKFRHDRSSPEVMQRAKKLVEELQINRQVALRLALLYDYEDLENGKRILHIYLGALDKLKHGFRCLKVNQKSLKISKKIISLDASKEYLRLGNDRKVGQRFQEDRCCVLKTLFRTYSLIFSSRQDMHDLCAVVDLFKGIHGPTVWQRDTANADVVFRMENSLVPMYNLQ